MALYICELHNDRRQLGPSQSRSIADLGDDVELRSVLVAMCKAKGLSARGHKLKIRETPGGYVKKEIHG